MTKTTPARFFREVKQEVGKITWPSRKETTFSSIMVLVMVVIAAIFFFIVDMTLSSGVQLLLGI